MSVQKWEYLFVRLDTSPTQGSFAPHYINGREIQNWKSPTSSLYEFFDQLGNEGWELVTQYTEISSVIFKRPKR